MTRQAAMKKSKEISIKPGDIFSIPIDEDRIGYGQVVATRKHHFLIMVFESIIDGQKNTDFQKLVHSKKLLMGNTLDAKIWHGDWKIVDNQTAGLDDISLPIYKLGTRGHFRAVDFSAKILGEISDELGEKLLYENIVSPIRYENALKAHHGIGEWRKDYDDLLFDKLYDSYKDILP